MNPLFPVFQVSARKTKAETRKAAREENRKEKGFVHLFATVLLLLLCKHMQNNDMCVIAEPSPEEKVQKLHTDIKFALKVDNPVRDADLFNPL